MNKFIFRSALALAVLGAGGLNAKGVVAPIVPGPPHNGLTEIEGAPLSIHVGDDQSFQVFNATIGEGVGQIFPSFQELGDMGWFVRVGSALNAPGFGHRASATQNIGPNTEFENRAVSGMTGAGTAASPFSVTVQGSASGLNLTQTVTYVNGQNYFRKSMLVANPSQASISARVFLASDIYLANSDSGTPYRDAATNSPGGQTCAGVTPVYTILHIPQGTVSPTAYTADIFSSVWTQIGAGQLNNSVLAAACVDNGAGLQWDITVPAGGNVTVQAATSFGDIPSFGAPPPAVPAPTLGTFGLAALVLALMALAGIALHRRD